MDVDAVRPEIENVRAALEWATEFDPELGVRLVVSLAQYWVPNAPAEGQRWLQSLLERAPELPAALKASSLRALGGLIYIQGDFAEGHRLHEQSLEEFRRLGDEVQVGLTLVRLSIEAHRTGDLTRARVIGEEALEICQQARQPEMRGRGLYALADVAFAEGRHDEAFQMMERSATLASEVGFIWWQVGALEHLAEFALDLERREDARKYIADGLRLADSINDRQRPFGSWRKPPARRGRSGCPDEQACCGERLRRRRVADASANGKMQRDDYLAKLESVSGAEFDEGRAQGQQLTLDEAVSAALAGPKERE